MVRLAQSRPPTRWARLIPVVAVVWAGSCGSTSATPFAPLRAAPEPASSPPLTTTPAGTVVPLTGSPEGVAVTGGGLVAVSVRNPDELIIFDLANAAPRRVIRLSGSARHLELEGPNGPLLVPQESDDRLVIIDLPSEMQSESVPVGRQPHDAAGRTAEPIFVSDEFGNTVHIIHPDGTATVVPAPLQPGGVAVSANGTVAVVVGVRARRISAYRPDGTVIGSANCGAGPTHVVAGSDGLFWVADTSGGDVLAFRVDAHGPKLVARVRVGVRPYGLAYDNRRDTLWVTLTGTNQLVGLHLRGGSVQERTFYSTVRQPNSVAVDVTSGELVVTGSSPAGAVELIG